MDTTSPDKTKLPLIRLNLARPFLDAATAAGAAVDQLLAPFGVNKVAFANPDMFLPAPTMYDVVEALADACEDPYIGVHLGAQLNPFQWSPLAQAARMASSVGDLLLRFSIDAYTDASSVIFKLETEGARTSFSELRLTDGGRLPRQNDGFGAAYVLSILHSAMGTDWDGRQVLVSVCDPDVFPSNYLGIRLARSDTQGFAIAFPCEWLLLNPKLQNTSIGHAHEALGAAPPQTTLETLHHVLQANLHDPGLTSGRVAELYGVSKRTLSRRLSEMGTSVKVELDQLRRKKAEAELSGTGRSVAEIGASVGYSDSTVFTRAFRRWTGKTPRQFRASL